MPVAQPMMNNLQLKNYKRYNVLNYNIPNQKYKQYD